MLATPARAEPADVATMMETARNVARRGHCDALEVLGGHIRERDAAFYERVFRMDPVVLACADARARIQRGEANESEPDRERPEPVVDAALPVGIAAGMSGLGVGLFALGLITIDHTSGNVTAVLTLGGAGLTLVGPSLGRRRADIVWNRWLGVRLASVAFGLGSFVWGVGACIDDTGDSSRCDAGIAGAMLGAGAYVVGTFVEIATIPRDMRTRARETSVFAGPVAGGATLGLAGSF